MRVATTSTPRLYIPLEGHTHLCFMSVCCIGVPINFCGLQTREATLNYAEISVAGLGRKWDPPQGACQGLQGLDLSSP